MQADGNLVLYDAQNTAPYANAWNAAIFGPNRILAMQTDGNLVIYDSTTTTAVWNTRTNGHPGAYLDIGAGALTVRSPSGGALWSTR